MSKNYFVCLGCNNVFNQKYKYKQHTLLIKNKYICDNKMILVTDKNINEANNNFNNTGLKYNVNMMKAIDIINKN